MSDRVYEDVFDVRFIGSVTNIHSDGDDRVQRLHQAPDRRFVCYEESGWVYFSARRTIKVPRSYIAHMEPMTVERAKQLGPNPYAPKAEPVQTQQQRNGK